MMMPPIWERMPKWQLKLMDMLTPASAVRAQVDSLLKNPDRLQVCIRNGAVFIADDCGGIMHIPPIPPKRFPLSKLRKDQLDKLGDIIEKQGV